MDVPEEEGPLGASGWAPKPCRAVRLDDMFFFSLHGPGALDTPMPRQPSCVFATSGRPLKQGNFQVFVYLFLVKYNTPNHN